MAEDPEFSGRVQRRPEGSYGGYNPVLLSEEEKLQSLEDILTLTAFQLYEVVRQSAKGLPLGVAIQAIAQKRGKKPEFTQVEAAVRQLREHFGDNFEVKQNGSAGHSILRIVPDEELVYSRKNPVK